jgi:phosphate transport system ATP-binding protein
MDSGEPVRASVRELSFWYGTFQALKDISLAVADRRVTAIIGASGCGKSTLLRCFNRMHDLYPGNRYGGEIILLPEGVNIVAKSIDPMLVRLQVGMVFQKPNPFPKSIFENVAAGLRIRGMNNRTELADRVEQALRQAALWEEAKDRLRDSAYTLSGGQQQRLCIARTIAPEPDIILLDEPTSALDPIATAKIEELIDDLASEFTLIIVTHSMQQAARVSNFTAFMHLGVLEEFGPPSRSSPIRKASAPRITSPAGSAREAPMADHIVKAFDQELAELKGSIGDMGRLAEQQLERALDALVAPRHRACRSGHRRGPAPRRPRAGGRAARHPHYRQAPADGARTCARSWWRSASHPTSSGSATWPRTSPSAPTRCRRRSRPKWSKGSGAWAIGAAQLKGRHRGLWACGRRQGARVWRSDEDIDTVYNSVFRELLTYMMEDPRTIGMATHLLVRGQEHRAHRRPLHQHRRKRLLHGARPHAGRGAPQGRPKPAPCRSISSRSEGLVAQCAHP